MDFDAALNCIKQYVELNPKKEYDGLIVKQLAASNTIGQPKSGKQTHIAITGEQMDIFPYLAPYKYLGCDYDDKDDSVKRYFILQLKINLYKANVNALGGDIVFSNSLDEKVVHMSVWRRRDEQSEQIQLSAINLDDEDLIKFRKLIHTNDYIIILKLKNKLEYDLLAVRSDSIIDTYDLKELNNKFLKRNTTTKIPTEDIPFKEESIYDFCYFASNLLLYGVPGCGKSYYVKQHYENEITNYQCKIRVVFHPDYTYSDFVGQIMPVVEKVIKEGSNGELEEKLKYKFVPGPFTRILKVANENKNEKCLLIIEELNRGNAPAIFGEVFQLLDRDDAGFSKYAIYNSDIANEVYDDAMHPVKLPRNLTIVATMNTSDQNVFTMDTAFQRRWQMKHIPNRFTGDSLDEATREHVAKYIPGSKISWRAFATIVNSKMGKATLGMAGTEDKSLGVYFATDNDLDKKDVFAEKVLKYLWDDAFRLARHELFKDHDKSLSYVIETFEDATGDTLQSVLQEAVYNEMQAEQKKVVNEDSSVGNNTPKDSSVDAE